MFTCCAQHSNISSVLRNIYEPFNTFTEFTTHPPRKLIEGALGRTDENANRCQSESFYRVQRPRDLLRGFLRRKLNPHPSPREKRC